MKSSAFRDELKRIAKSIPFEISFLKKKGNDHRITVNDEYLNEIFINFHKDCIKYIEKWIEPLKELNIWTWAALKKIPDWKEIEPCFDMMLKNGFFVKGDDVKLHAEYSNLKLILENLLPKWESITAQLKQVEKEKEEARLQRATTSTATTSNTKTQQKITTMTMAQLKAAIITTEKKWIDVFAAFSEKELSFDRIFKLVEYAMVIPGI